ncbi:MAG: response regulator transcription factor [Xanthomonadales bacterium]|nr:response regulator transcription factor [Xanthomonadales bacterium]
MTAWRVLVADDHPLFREALVGRVRQLLPEASLVEVDDLPALQAAISADEAPDLLLLDLHMPGAEGLSALVHVRALSPTTAVVVVSATEDDAVIQRALSLGAAGFIPKSASLPEIGRALQCVLAGEIATPEGRRADAGKGLAEAEDHAARRIGQLSPQQYRIATMLAAGLLNKQIAWELGISEATVKVHMSTILRKLGARNRTQVALLMQVLDFGGSIGAGKAPREARRS